MTPEVNAVFSAANNYVESKSAEDLSALINAVLDLPLDQYPDGVSASGVIDTDLGSLSAAIAAQTNDNAITTLENPC